MGEREERGQKGGSGEESVKLSASLSSRPPPLLASGRRSCAFTAGVWKHARRTRTIGEFL